MSAIVDVQLLHSRWVHSYEESKGGRIVFRTSDYDFPRSRGRSAITLEPDGTILTEYPGPTDRTAEATGNWSLEGSLLTMSGPKWSGTFKVEAIDQYMLVISEYGKEI